MSYEIQGKKIIIKKAQSVATSPQQGKVAGRIVDDNGEPVIGATVKVQGTSIGTTTDIDGNFTLDAASNATLEVSCIGYQTQVLKAQNGKHLLSR